jgi:hypothetical protein
MKLQPGKFDAIELNTVVFQNDPNGDRYADTLTSQEQWEELQDSGVDDSDIHYSVYAVHLIDGGVQCLCDCATPEDARAIGAALAEFNDFHIGENGVIDNLFIPPANKSGVFTEPRDPMTLLREIIKEIENKRMPLRMDEADPKIHGAKPGDYFGEFDNYYDDSDAARAELAQHSIHAGGLMVSGGSVRVCWPELANLIDEAKAVIDT